MINPFRSAKCLLLSASDYPSNKMFSLALYMQSITLNSHISWQHRDAAIQLPQLITEAAENRVMATR